MGSIGKGSDKNKSSQSSIQRSSSSSVSNSASNQFVDPSQQWALRSLYSRAMRLPQQKIYKGDLTANFTPEQLRGQQMGRQFASGEAGRVYDSASGAWEDALTADPSQNPYFQSALMSATRPLIQNFQEQVLPSIGGDAIDAGQFGSSRHGIAEGLASRGLTDAMGDIYSRMGNEAYTSGLQSRLSALGMSPDIMNLGLTPSNVMRQIGGEQQALQQASIDANVNRFMLNQELPYKQLSTIRELLGAPTVVGRSTSSSRGTSSSYGRSRGKGKGSSSNFGLGIG